MEIWNAGADEEPVEVTGALAMLPSRDVIEVTILSGPRGRKKLEARLTLSVKEANEVHQYIGRQAVARSR